MAVTLSELNAQEEAAKAAGKTGIQPSDVSTEDHQAAQDSGRKEQKNQKNRRNPQKEQTSSAPPESLRLQYEYELERSREVSSSINRLTVTIPILIAAICLICGLLAPLCTNHMPLHLMLILGVADIIVLLGALVVACTVHFYILNPAPSQPSEKDWLTKMKRDLQRGNNWRAWLVFVATLLIYLSAATTLALLIICILGM